MTPVTSLAPLAALLLAAGLCALPAQAGTLERPAVLPTVIELDVQRLAAADPVQVSAHFVDQVIRGVPVRAHLEHFRKIDAEALDRKLDTQARQLAFWINIYNGYTQHFLKTDPALYLKNRSKYFGLEQVEIAGDRVSLEDIEHGVLRRGATTLSLGHVRTLALRRPFIQRFAVDAVDYRIHFALNCGARSCPPVLPYTADAVNAQLDVGSRDYLSREVRYDAAAQVVHVPALLRWFSADFDGGSREAKLAILRRHGALPAGVTPEIEYRDYDWTLQIENYAVYRP